MKKMILMGTVACGKTTLCQRLHGIDLHYHKTQAVHYFDNLIDTPGEFVQHRHFYSALTVSAADASVIALLQSVTDEGQTFSPLFASIFQRPVIGIVTKIDLAENEERIARAERQLQVAGAKRIFRVSSVSDVGIEELQAYLNEIGKCCS